MSFARGMRRVVLLIGVVALPLLATGCYYQDYDLCTVDHYCHYGTRHSEEVTFYNSDGCDDF